MDKISINLTYVNALTKLLKACAFFGIEINSVEYLWGGFRVTFKGYPDADAICHDFSYGHKVGQWESMGFVWDNDDISTSTPEELACLLFLNSEI